MAFSSRVGSVRMVQWSARAPRVAVSSACVVLVAAGLHSLLAAGAPATGHTTFPAALAGGARAEAVAEGFARAYLTSGAARLAALGIFAPGIAAAERNDPLPGPPGGESVLWSAVADDQPVADGRRIVVVVQTTRGFTALVVTTRRATNGAVVVADYPAIVGPPPVQAADPAPAGEAVADGSLSATVMRALGNFLGRRRGELAADLLPGSVVVVPAQPLGLAGVDGVSWAAPGRVVSVVLRARPASGGLVRLAYSVGVVHTAGRWFVSWIAAPQTQTDGRR